MFLEGVLLAVTPLNILILILGTIYGIIMGALPGIGSTLAMALLLPFTFGMEPASALILLGAVYASSVYGGSVAAILLNTPGTVTNTATCFDGYPMAQKGKAGMALGLSATSSLIGGLVSIIVLILFAPIVADFALKFGPAEYFLLAVLGLSIISSVAGANPIKGYFSAGFGLLLSFVGYQIVTGEVRYASGVTYLFDGIQLIPALIGLFAVSQVLTLATEGGTIAKSGKLTGSFWQGVKQTFMYPVTIIRSSALGVLFGAIPAIGGTAANFIAYTEAMRTSKKPEEFGKGCPEGIVAPETANNAIVGGALIPTLTLALPGSPPAAIFLGALMMYGIQPGADLFFNKGEIVYTLFIGLILAQFAFFLVGFLGAGILTKVTLVSNKVLVPAILVLTLVGSFAVRNVIQDVLIAVLFGFIGYVMNKYGYSTVAVVLALILGPIAEKNFYRALASSDNLAAAFSKPISLVLIALIVLVAMYPVIKRKLFPAPKKAAL